MKLSPLIALTATGVLLITGCSAPSAPAPESADNAAQAPAEYSAAPTPTPESGGLATFDQTTDFPSAIVESTTHDGFDYDGLHIKLEAAEIMPIEEVTVESFYEDMEGLTPIRFTFDLVNVTAEPFPLEEFMSSAYGGENYYPLESEPGIMDGEPITEELPRRIAGNNSTPYIVTYSVPDEHLDQPVLLEISPSYEGPIVEYFVHPESVTEWEG